jgi:hypothetical protein
MGEVTWTRRKWRRLRLPAAGLFSANRSVVLICASLKEEWSNKWIYQLQELFVASPSGPRPQAVISSRLLLTGGNNLSGHSHGLTGYTIVRKKIWLASSI